MEGRLETSCGQERELKGKQAECWRKGVSFRMVRLE
jgi:hypothetical protein